MKTYRVAVTGGRKHEITREEAGKLEYILHAESTIRTGDWGVVLIHGDAPGVDRRAAELAEYWGYPTVPIPAPWDALKKLLGEKDPRWKAAGNIRNGQLLQAVDLLVAFPGGRGTADCIRQARTLGIDVVEV